jgi:hypothetical protein
MSITDNPMAFLEDDYAKVQARLAAHPEHVASLGRVVELTTFLGHTETWIVKTIRLEGGDTVLLQRVGSDGGERFVLPAEVTAAIASQRDYVIGKVREQGAKRGVATKRAGGGPGRALGRRK